MRAYKFRSSAQVEFALDIILNGRLRCSDWRKLNDPMEGLFFYNSRGDEPYVEDFIRGIGGAKSRYKVCSLSADFQSHLLWAHYAGGFDGLAIEVELPDHDHRIQKVQYRGVFHFLDIQRIRTEDQAARDILFSKYQEWSYEQEIRILSEDDWYKLASPVRRVIAGQRMNQALFSTLAMVCEKQGIEFCKVGIGDEGVDADPVRKSDIDIAVRRARKVPRRRV